MGRTLLTGATGTLGTALQPRLTEAGVTVRETSRSPPDGDGPVDEWVELTLADGLGTRDAIADVDVIVHAATDPRGDHEAVDVRGTERLLEAAAGAEVEHVVYVSIVGVDEIPYSYDDSKHAAERAVEESPVPETIVRCTQFHPFLDRIGGALDRLPVWPLPTSWRCQPIAVGEAADAITEHATAEPAGRAPVVGGPEVLTVRELAEAYRGARSIRRPIVRVPIPGDTSRAVRAGTATCPDRDVGDITWAEYLAAEYS